MDIERAISTRKCSSPSCDNEFVVQHGGQKSGASPAVHIEKPGDSPTGFCSTECLFETNGKSQDYQNYVQEYKRFFGAAPTGREYLPPARRIENYQGGD